MYLRKLTIKNIRSIENLSFEFSQSECPGWHVILGANGAGKSSVIRSLALALAGPKEAVALRQNWNNWQRFGETESSIEIQIKPTSEDVFQIRGKRALTVDAKIEFKSVETTLGGPKVEIRSSSGRSSADRSVWGANAGWFSSSFGPFRRFSGGDQSFDRLFYSNPRLAPHLSAFGEDVALTEGIRWLRDLRVAQLEERPEGLLLSKLIDFLNSSDLLPNGATISGVNSEEVVISDADGYQVAVEQMSDGYRAVLSMIFEILRQMTKAYGVEVVSNALDSESCAVKLPGVVAIDEVDAHLHPSWQAEIGPWFIRCFPLVQFIVTTHSPIICRAAKTVWRLANPGSDEQSGQVVGSELGRLIYGSILEAYGTDYFGQDIDRSEESRGLLMELASLNRQAIRGELSKNDAQRLDSLRATLPTDASVAEAEAK